MYKLIDRQNMGTFSSLLFATKEKVREQLVSYHSIDWTGENDINTLSLDDLLDYGDWELVELTKEELVTEVHNTLSEIDNDDRDLEEALRVLVDSVEEVEEDDNTCEACGKECDNIAERYCDTCKDDMKACSRD